MVCFACEEFRIGALTVPPLELRTGELVCLHLPYLQTEIEQEQLTRILTGERRSPAVHSHGRVVWAEPAAVEGGFLPHLFNRQSALSWLCHAAGISRIEAREISDRLGISSSAQVEDLPLTRRNLLGLEAAWLHCPDVIVFTTAGCDLDGVRTTYDSVLARLDHGAAIHLSYPYVIASPDEVYQPLFPRFDQFAAQHPDFPFVRAERRCHSSARCIELTQESITVVRI